MNARRVARAVAILLGSRHEYSRVGPGGAGAENRAERGRRSPSVRRSYKQFTTYRLRENIFITSLDKQQNETTIESAASARAGLTTRDMYSHY